MRINNYTLEPEQHALNRFCLRENFISTGLPSKPIPPTPSVRTIGYGMSLMKCLRTIAFRETNDLGIQEFVEWKEAYEKKMDSLAFNLKPIEKMLYEYMDDKRVRKTGNVEALRKYREEKKNESI